MYEFAGISTAVQDVLSVPTCGQPHEQCFQVYNQTSLKNRDSLFSEFSNPCSVITGHLGKTTNTGEQISRSLPVAKLSKPVTKQATIRNQNYAAGQTDSSGPQNIPLHIHSINLY